MIEMNVRDDRYGRTVNDRRHGGRIGRIFDGDAHDFGAFHSKAVDLGERRIRIRRVGRCHRLHDNRIVAADPNGFGVVLSGLVLQEHRFALTTNSNHLKWTFSVNDLHDVVKIDDKHERD